MPHDARRRQIAGIVLVLVSAAAFALSPVAAKFAYAAGAGTLTVVTLRAAIGAAVLAPLLLAQRRALLLRGEALRLGLIAGVASSLVSYGFIGAVAYIPVSLAMLIFFTHPLLVAGLWHWQGKERLAPAQLGFGLMVLSGLGLALGTAFAGLDPRGLALAALASGAVTWMIVLSARARLLASSAEVNFCVAVASAVLCGLVTTSLGAWVFPAGLAGWLGVLGAGLGVTVGLLGFLAAFRFMSPVRATMLSNVEPLFGILLAMLLLGEVLTGWQWVGVGLVLAGLVLFERPRR